MPKSEKVKVNVKERVTDNVCDLSLSELNEVPVREITTYKRVTVLDLSSNRLITLGKNFTSLTRLVKLDLSKNQIKYLPEDFGLLRNLKHLDLYDNKLEHLPLSFGDLSSLRYLDLKGNPLTPALGKIVGFCLTTKDCQDSAKNTVKFLAQMQLQAEKAKDQYVMEALHGQETVSANKPTTTAAATATTTTVTTTIETNATENQNQTTKKSNNKKSKTKQKNKTTNNNGNKKDANTASSGQKTQAATVNVHASKPAKAKKNSNGKKQGAAGKAKKGSTALTSIFVFCFLLGVNIAVIYMIMFKNPEIADKLVEFIPHRYRDWILSKTEFFRLRVTDWITEFRTQPEEH